MSRTESAQAFARNHPYVAFGVLLFPVTYGITGDIMTALFTGGIVAFGPAIAEGFRDADLSDDSDTTSEGNNE